MFDSWFQPTPKDIERQKAIKDMFYYANRKNNKYVYNIISGNLLDLNSNECKDEYNNSLLHIAVSSDNHDLVRKLLLIGSQSNELPTALKELKNLEPVKKTQKNNFNELPIDIALKNRNIEMIKILESIGLNTEDCVNLRKIISETKLNLNDTRNNLKRKRDECDEHIVTIKKLKDSNTVLTNDNIELRKTVTALRSSFKK